MSIAAQRAALLALVDDDRRRQCEDVLATADAQAAQLRAQAHAQARARAREAVSAARERRDAALAAAQARRQTRERLARQGRAAQALALAWAELPRELERRWRDPAAREAWMRDALSRASRELGAPAAAWQLRHAGPETFAPGAAPVPAGVACVADAALGAGLRIACGGNVLDASRDGLLADRDAVAAAILGHLGGAP